MRLISSLIVVFISLVVLVEQNVAGKLRDAQLRHDGTFIAHPEPSQELSKNQLLEQLKDFDYESEGDLPSAEHVANLLYKTEAKETTEVVDGVTVAELIAQNEFKSLELGCTKEAFERRARVYGKIRQSNPRSPYRIYIGISVYAVKLLRLATHYCYQNKSKLVKNGINTKIYIDDLSKAYYQDALADAFYEKEVVRDVSQGLISRIAILIIRLENDRADSVML